MQTSILAGSDRLSLGDGLNLRLLSGLELLQARREAWELACDPAEQPLCSNACLLARALELDGGEGPLFRTGREVLIGLTAEEIERLAARWDTFRRSAFAGGESWTEEGTNLSFDETRFTREEGVR